MHIVAPRGSYPLPPNTNLSPHPLSPSTPPSVSTLQDVLVYASPRLLNPATAISSSLASFSATASTVIGLTINSTAQLAQVLLLPDIPADLLNHK